MHLRGSAVVALALAASLSPTAATAKCARVEMGPVPITRASSKIPSDGGILVGISVTTDNPPPAQPDADVSQVAYKATTAGGKPVTLVMASLAPGFTVYRPKPALTGPLTLAAGKTSFSVTYGAAKGAALPVPSVSALAVTTVAGFRGSLSTTAVASVASVPDAAVGLIVYRMKDEENVPLTYGTPAHDKTGATTVVVYTAGGHCGGAALPNQQVPAAGEDVSFAWVDAFGRLSPVSAPVRVQ